MTTRLFINDVFELNDRKLRLVHVSQQTKCAYVVPLDGSTDPIEWKLDTLLSLKSGNGMRLVLEEPAQRPTPSQKDIDVRNTRWNAIEGLVTHPEIWDKRRRPALLKVQAARVNMSPKALRAFLRMYWSGGQNQDALLGHYYRSGRIDETTDGALNVVEKSPNGPQAVIFAPAKQKSRGRHPADEGHRPFAIPAALREMLLTDAKELYETDYRISVSGVTTTLLNRYFAIRDADGNLLHEEDGAARLKPVGQRPSYRQIQYMLTKALVLSAAFKRRNSEAEYQNDHAPSTGSVLDDTMGPGDVYEIDATVLDVYVVARANRRHIIGKPALFLVIDRSSRLITGFYLTLENPSWAEATQAILSISGDWEALCKRLGVPYKKSDWPAAGVMPNRIFGDRADMITFESNALCDGVNVQVTNAPALMSADKAIVESGFKSLQAKLRQHAPGYEPPLNVHKRRGKAYHRDAALTLDEMAAVLLRIIIAHNKKAKQGYQASPEEILSGSSTAPIDIWQDAVQERMGLMTRMPIDLLRRKLMPRGTATVTKQGVYFLGCTYEAPELAEWFARASIKGTFDVQVSYMTNLVDTVIVHDRFSLGKEYVAKLTSKSQAFAGYTFAEVKYVTAAASKNKRAATRKNEGHDVAALEGINAVSRPALQEVQALPANITPGMRLTNGDKLRVLEAADRRREVLGGDSPNPQYAAITHASEVAVFEDVPDEFIEPERASSSPAVAEVDVPSIEVPQPAVSSAQAALHSLLGIN